jgi:hypothetical protein
MRREIIRMVNLVVALVFLRGAGAALATDVIFVGNQPTRATGITNLDIDGRSTTSTSNHP